MRRFLRFPDLKARGTVSNRTQLANLQNKYGFPKGRLLGPNTRAWTEAEVAAWEDSRPTQPKVCPVPKHRPGRPRKRSAEITTTAEI
jgi:predicted DNA-binding transcriptional regulator AlpA